ncbi:MAG: GNAT family N-acetyltransferase [Dehalococcoidia bacterium]
MSEPLSLPIETDRLLLRDFAADDWRAVHVYSSDPEVVRYLFWGPNDEADTRAFIERTLTAQTEQPRTAYGLAVIRKADGLLIGACELRLRDQRGGDIGYVYRRDVWGQGYASEAARALVGAGFSHFGLHRIYATCDPGNIGSARVLEHCGMQREGHLRQHQWRKTSWRDSYLYAVIEDEWKASAIPTV